MSPEQMVGGMCTAASDLYTLGIVMYEMIAGRKPFDDATSPAAALAAALTMTPERLSTYATVPPDVDRLVMRCLERLHADRFQSSSELAAALDEILLDEVETRTSSPTPVPFGQAATLLGHAPITRTPVPVAPTPAPRAHTPTPRAHTPAPVAQTPVPVAPTPVPLLQMPAPVAPAPGVPPAMLTPASGLTVAGTPQAGMQLPAKNLREVFPALARPTPSPMQVPPRAGFDEPPTPITGLGELRPRRGRPVRWLAIAFAIALAVAAALAIVRYG
jgi:serine/threonine-protein kinase